MILDLVDLSASTKGIEQAINQATVKLNNFVKKIPKAELDLDISDFDSATDKALKDYSQFLKKVEQEADINVDINPALDNITELDRVIEKELNDKTIKLEAELDKKKIDEFSEIAKKEGIQAGDKFGDEFKKEGTQGVNKVETEIKEMPAVAHKAGIKAGDKFASSFKSAGMNIWTFIKGSLLVGGVMAIGSAVKGAVNNFVELDKQVKNIGTLGVQNFEEFAKLTTELSKKVPESAANIASGVYDAISAGIQGTNKEILAFTEVASKAGVAGMSTTKDAINGLTSVMNAYKMPVEKATEVSDTFFAAIKLGKTTFNEMNAALANVIPAASSAGISFKEVSANIAQMTALGVPTSQASTQIRQAIIELQKPGKDLANVMKGVTVEIDGVKTTLSESNIGQVLRQQGLTKTLQDIEQSAGKMGLSLTQVFSSSEAASAALLLTGENAERASQMIKNVNEEVSKGASTQAYEVAAKSVEVQMKVLKNNITAGFMGILEPLLPIVNDFLGKFINQVMPAFQSMIDGIAPAITQLIGAIMPAITDLMNSLMPAITDLMNSLMPAITDLMNSLMPVITDVLNTVVPIVSSMLSSLMPVIDKLMQGLSPIIAVVVELATVLMDALMPVVTPILDLISEIIVALQPLIVDLLKMAINIFQELAEPIKIAIILLTEMLKTILVPLLPLITDILSVFKPFIPLTIKLINPLTILFKLFEKIITALFGGKDAGEAMGNAMKKLGDIMQGIVSIIQGVVNAVNDVVSAISGAVNDVLEFFGLVEEKKSQFEKDFEKMSKEEQKALSDKAMQDFKQSQDMMNNLIKQAQTQTTEVKKDAVEKTEKKTIKPPSTPKPAGTVKDKTIDELIKDLANLALAGKQGTAEFEKLQDKIVKLQGKEITLNNQIERTRALLETKLAEQGILTPAMLEKQKKAFEEFNNYLKDLQGKTSDLGKKLEKDITSKIDDLEDYLSRVKKDEVYIQVDVGLNYEEAKQKKILEIEQRINTMKMNQELDAIYKTLDEEIKVEQTKYEEKIKLFAENSVERMVLEEEFNKWLNAREEYTYQQSNVIKEKYLKIGEKLEKESQKRIEEIRRKNVEEFLNKFSDYSNILKEFTENIKVDLEVKEDGNLKKVKDELKSLDEQVKNNEISYEDYARRRAEIERENADEIIKINEERNRYLDGLNKGLIAGLNAMSQMMDKQLTDTLNGLKNKIFEIKEANESTTVKMTVNWEELGKSMTEIGTVALGSMSVALGKALAEGGNAGQALLTSLLDTAQKAILVYSAEIFGAFVGMLGPFGIPAALGAIATLTGLLQLAKSAIGAETGVVGIDDSYNKPRGITDTIPIWVAKGETILSKEVTEKQGKYLSNREILERTLKTGASIEDVVLNTTQKRFEERNVLNVNKKLIDIDKRNIELNIENQKITDVKRKLIGEYINQSVIDNKLNVNPIDLKVVKIKPQTEPQWNELLTAIKNKKDGEVNVEVQEAYKYSYDSSILRELKSIGMQLMNLSQQLSRTTLIKSERYYNIKQENNIIKEIKTGVLYR